MHQGGRVTLTVHGDEGVTNGEFSYSAARRATTIAVDPAASLSGILEKVVSGRFDPEKREVEIRTVRGVRVVMKLADRNATYPLQALLIQTGDGFGMAVGQVTLGAVPKERLAGRSAADVKKLGMPVRDLTDADLKDLNILPTKAFGEREEERAAAKAFRGLFPTTHPAAEPG
jgi:hypothetical protein